MYIVSGKGMRIIGDVPEFGESPCQWIEQSHSTFGSYPDVVQMIHKYGAYIVSRQALRIIRLMPECFDGSSFYVKYAHSVSCMTYI